MLPSFRTKQRSCFQTAITPCHLKVVCGSKPFSSSITGLNFFFTRKWFVASYQLDDASVEEHWFNITFLISWRHTFRFSVCWLKRVLKVSFLGPLSTDCCKIMDNHSYFLRDLVYSLEIYPTRGIKSSLEIL